MGQKQSWTFGWEGGVCLALMSPSPPVSTTHDHRASPDDAAHEAEGEEDGESLWHFTQEERLRFERQFVELVPTID